MKIVLFGGTFDPWTSAHQEIAETLSRLYDRVIVIPTDIKYYKENEQMFSFEERICEARSKVQNLQNVRIIDLEKNIDNNWRFVNTLDAVRRMYGQEHEYFVAIGSDSLQKFTTWTKWQEILEKSKLLVFNRPGYTQNFPDIPFEYLPMENPVSSTQLREELRNSDSASFNQK